MKKLLCALLALPLLLSGCANNEEVTYFETKAYIRQSTGDINLLEKTYDENGNLLLTYVTLNGNFSSKTEYEYSEDYTLLTTKTTFDNEEPKSSQVVRTFDDKGRVIRSETCDSDQQISTSEYTYDDNGEMVFIQSTYPDSDVVITLQRDFDDRGNLIRYIQATEYSVGRYEYSYNKQNQRIKEEYYRDNELLEYTDFVWEGNVGTGTHFNADGTPTGKKVLEYDDHGNLLRLESLHLSGSTISSICYEYTGTDGSISSGIPE